MTWRIDSNASTASRKKWWIFWGLGLSAGEVAALDYKAGLIGYGEDGGGPASHEVQSKAGEV